MSEQLFVLDGLPLLYRSHFALMSRPVFSASGLNTSALLGFTHTLLDILENRNPTHRAAALDLPAPTHRHRLFPDYKAHREAMPEEIAQSLPHLRRLLAALNIPVLTCEGFEADDIIGTLARRAQLKGWRSFMVSPDKDLGQLVSESTFLFKPSRSGQGIEILGPSEIGSQWGIQRPAQLIDILGLWGDAVDNIPGVPGIGEKTAMKLISAYGSVESALEHLDELKGRLRENLAMHRDQALLSKRLATIDCAVPIKIDLEDLRVRPPDEEELKNLLKELGFASISQRIFGRKFRAKCGWFLPPPSSSNPATLAGAAASIFQGAATTPAKAEWKVLAQTPHQYRCVSQKSDRTQVLQELSAQPCLAIALATAGDDAKEARILGLGFSHEAYRGCFFPAPDQTDEIQEWLKEFQPLLADPRIEKVGHGLKFDLSVLKWHGLSTHGSLFDCYLAHVLAMPQASHRLADLSTLMLGYEPLPPAEGAAAQIHIADATIERADLAGQLRDVLVPRLKEKGQERVFLEIEAPLLPVLIDMEFAGVRLDAAALEEWRAVLVGKMAEEEQRIFQLAGRIFSLNAPLELGRILFEELKISDVPKRTRTGLYAQDEQTLSALAPQHEIISHLLNWRRYNTLKAMYLHVLPRSVLPRTGRVHTTYQQLETAAGRLNSKKPNLQNIPIRTELGQEVRKAFVPRNEDYLLLSADYSQIELRILAALAHEENLIHAFKLGADIHQATAARVFGIRPEEVTFEMRSKAKMVNYGIVYGMSASGLSERLGISRKEAAEFIEHYFIQFPGIRNYMAEVVQFARLNGYVETLTGRRRYLPEIASSNATVRRAAERNAINAPVQGTAADMIKIAMIRIHQMLVEQKLRTQLLLQVHDELVFDLCREEEAKILPVVEGIMRTALPLDEVPVDVVIGQARNWLAAHAQE